MKKAVILLCSSNSQGETSMLVHYLQELTQYPIIDLKQKKIGHFDYEFNNQDDDFLALIRELVDNYDLLVFATPVYWYTMSGICKVFFDRFSDCLKIEKDTGRKLRGMQMAVLSCGYDEELKPGFHMPFIESAKYLGMEYIGDVHGWIKEAEHIPQSIQQRIQQFAARIK